ncbi:MAG: hypothetical protein SA378_10180 [Sedimentibacter sp.]|uniref:hypothetical protein n=1 Tax=Sedimentibacter sp. TaxID=1960295 RepID=UPI0029813802|nr:hypothetical protein [Sedimentibacter sp.]MDW5300490.1 hypothetical protein [Sedimentibacter sp.]
MKTRNITRFLKIIDYTTDYESFDTRLRFEGIDNQYIPFLWDLYMLIRFTDFTPEHVKEVFNSDITYQDVADKFGLSLGSVKAEVHNFSKKLDKVFQGDILGQIIDKESIDQEYFKKLELLVVDSLKRRIPNSKDILEKSFSINLLNVPYKKEELPEIGMEEFKNIKNIVMTFSIPLQEYSYNKMNVSHKQYISYLLNTNDTDLGELDRKRKKEILNYCQIR